MFVFVFSIRGMLWIEDSRQIPVCQLSAWALQAFIQTAGYSFLSAPGVSKVQKRAMSDAINSLSERFMTGLQKSDGTSTFKRAKVMLGIVFEFPAQAARGELKPPEGYEI